MIDDPSEPIQAVHLLLANAYVRLRFAHPELTLTQCLFDYRTEVRRLEVGTASDFRPANNGLFRDFVCDLVPTDRFKRERQN